MFEWKKWIKVIIIIPATILFFIETLIRYPIDSPISTIMLTKIMGTITTDNSRVFVFVMEKQFYLVLFNIMFGNYIYEHFRFSSVYVFTRINSRKNWIIKEYIELLLISIIYTGLFLLTCLFICKKGSLQLYDSEVINVFITLYFNLVILIFWSTLLINLLALRYGNIIAFIIVYIAFTVLMFIGLKQQYIQNKSVAELLYLVNPVSGVLNGYTYNTFLKVLSYIFKIVFVTITTIIGEKYIAKMDIALEDCENK